MPRHRRDSKGLAAFQARALDLFGQGFSAARVAKIMRESERYLQRKAKQWLGDGLVVEGPYRLGPRGTGRNYCLTESGARLMESLGRPTTPHHLIGRSAAVGRPITTTPSSPPRTGRPPGARRRGHRRKEDGGEFYSGARNFFYTAAVLHPGRRVISQLKESYRGFRGFKRVHHGLLRVGDPDVRRVRVTWFVASMTVRFDVFAQGRTAAQVETLADTVALGILKRFTLENGVVFGKVRLSGDPDHEVLGNKAAEALLAQGVRAETVTEKGTRVMIDASKGPAVEFRGPRAKESVPAWLRVGDNVERLIQEAKENRVVLEAQTKILAEMVAGQKATTEGLQSIRQVLEERLPKPAPAPPKPPQNREAPPLDKDSGMFG